MLRINPINIVKPWGTELYLHSPLPGRTTVDENGNPTISGLLVKIVTSNERLSVQVHPDDKMAKKLENAANGKSECWYVVSCKKDQTATIVGLKDYAIPHIRTMLEQNQFEQNLVGIKAKVGDFINIPAGLVHSLGGGVEVLEVQQPSDVTYRYYDWGRTENGKPRPLHLEKALQCQKELDYNLNPSAKEPLTYENTLAQFVFPKSNYKLLSDALVVDFDKKCGYFGIRSEKLPPGNWAVIYQSKDQKKAK